MRSRRRRRFRKLRRKFLKRRLRRPRLRRRRARRRAFGSYSVGYHQDYELAHQSFVPSENIVNGTSVGVRPTDFCTWSIPVLPPNLFVQPLQSEIGNWQTDTNHNIYHRSIVPTLLGQQGNPPADQAQLKALTDFPNIISADALFSKVNALSLAKLCTSYRIAWVALSFTVPENLGDGEHNHHLYLEWCHLPQAKACMPDDLIGITLPSSEIGGESYGWNWLCSPMSIMEACSVSGKSSLRHKWHRAQLTSSAPVTIKFRPRHAAIRFDRQYSRDSYIQNNNQVTKAIAADRFANSPKLVRSYLPIEDVLRMTDGRNASDHLWFGPVVRLIDADINQDIAANSQVNGNISKYHIRVSMTLKLKLKGIKAADPLFPLFDPAIPL